MSGERETPGQRPRHSDLDVWKDAMRLVREVYRVTSKFPDEEQFGLTRQFRRSAIGVPSSIAEEAGHGGRVELVRFLVIARGPLSELDTRLWIARDPDYLAEADALQESIQLPFAKINALFTSKRQPDIRGSQ